MAARSDQGLPRVIQRFKADMRANPRKRFILIALLPVMIVVWVPVLKGGSSSPSPPRPTTPSSSSPGEEAAAPPPPIDLELRGRLGELVGDLDVDWEPVWAGLEDEHPFGIPVNQSDEDSASADADPRQRVAPGSKEDDEARLAATLFPTSTFLSEKHGDVAIIDGFPYRTGEEIEHFVIQEIKTRAVVLKGLHGIYELDIPLEQKRSPLRNKDRR